MTETRAEVLPEHRERKLRYAAQRQRAVLYKSRLRDQQAHGYGNYWLICHDGTVIGVDEDHLPTLSLDDAERLLRAGLVNAVAA
jgi:hypothetical protein